MDPNGQIVLSIHQWQYFGQDLQLHQKLRIITRPVTGGKDGHLLTRLFNLSHQMEQSILDKQIRVVLEIAILSLQCQHVQNSHL